MSKNNIGLGSLLTVQQAISFIDQIFSFDDNDYNLIKPICIWGKAGIGKTQLVKDYAKNNGYDFAYIAPAQFEEMGDFHGIPHVVNGKTVYNQPLWVPEDNGKPGILLIDDFNRADDRILRGLMQLFQNHGMMSWKLPAKWKIICTANPEDADYSVTTLDDAMLTRMMHISLKFEPKEWAEWALKNMVDERGVNFVLTYPEIIDGKLTNPRSITSFFYHIKNIVDLKKSSEFIFQLATSLLDKETASSFIAFLNDELDIIISPEEILNSKKITEVINNIRNNCVKNDSIRLDILSTIVTRLTVYLKENMESIDKFNNLADLLLADFMPNDLRTTLHLELNYLNDERIKKVINTVKISKLIIGDNT